MTVGYARMAMWPIRLLGLILWGWPDVPLLRMLLSYLDCKESLSRKFKKF